MLLVEMVLNGFLLGLSLMNFSQYNFPKGLSGDRCMFWICYRARRLLYTMFWS